MKKSRRTYNGVHLNKKSNTQDVVEQSLTDHPRTGTGHPEALRGGNEITYSRHITAHDRIIYDIYDEEIYVLVVEVEGHYNDK